MPPLPHPRSLLQRTSPPHPHLLPPPPPRRPFHQTSRRYDDLPNHYATLSLPPTASPAQIKSQFYKLSKAHHPDLHPTDPNASARFVKISEAHAVLASASSKVKYDRDYSRVHGGAEAGGVGGTGVPTGSYSSHTNPAGGRPASGLSRRRTQFRGPPPSFYRSGGWGQQSEKRAEHSEKASHSHEAGGTGHWSDSASSNNGNGPAGTGPAGTGPGGFATGHDNDVRHFDQQGHYRTHSTIERTRHKARRRAWSHRGDDDVDYGGGGSSSVLFNFVLMSGVLASILGISYGLFGYGSASGGSHGKGKKSAGNDDGAA